MSAIAAILFGKERRLVNRLRTAGATNPGHARSLEELGLEDGLILHRLRDRAVVRHAGPDRYYLDEESWNAVRRSRRRAVHISWLIVLIGLLALLFARTVLAP